MYKNVAEYFIYMLKHLHLRWNTFIFHNKALKYQYKNDRAISRKMNSVRI